MDINFFDEIQPCIIDRLGRIYNSDSKYKKSIEAETKILSQLKEHLTESQMQLVKNIIMQSMPQQAYAKCCRIGKACVTLQVF